MKFWKTIAIAAAAMVAGSGAWAQAPEKKTIDENASLNVKRSFYWNKNWLLEKEQGPYFISDLQEIKTTWHPVENIGSGGAKY